MNFIQNIYEKDLKLAITSSETRRKQIERELKLNKWEEK